MKVSVETFYQEQYSKPIENSYFFAYRITIFNGGDFSVQLLRRHWFIFDSNAIKREVEGEGVIGQQPIIHPGESHQYISGCNLKTNIGKMHGTYLMERIDDKKQFYINIPEFTMIALEKSN
ncbi:MAG: Co2+/Mg2+ efflux protein ApaG [Chitinophagales bacterium]